MYWVASRIKAPVTPGSWEIPPDACFRSLRTAQDYINAEQQLWESVQQEYITLELEYMVVKEYGALC